MTALSPELYQRRNGLAAAWLTLDMLAVGLAGVAAYHVGHPLAYAIAFVVVGARGQSLYVLQHEAMHGLLFSRRAVNDRLGIVLSAFIGTRFYQGRAIHMLHHRRVGQAGDPNEVYHGLAGKAPAAQFIGFLLFALLGGRLLILCRDLANALLGAFAQTQGVGQAPSATTEALKITASQKRSDLLALVLVQSFMLLTITATSAWYCYFLLYVLPLATLTSLLEALRSFSEHVLPDGAPSNDAEANRRFFMRCGPVERFFISPHGFHHHHVHHLYPNVPTFNVASAHALLLSADPGFRAGLIVRPGYVGTAWRYLRRRPIPGGGGGAAGGK